MISVINDEISSNIDDLVEILKKTNIKYVELRKINNDYLHNIKKDNLIKYFKILKANKLQISLIDSPLGKNKYTHYKEKQLLFEYIKICKIFNCKNLRIFANIGEKVIDALNEYNEIALKNNIILLIENEKDTFGEDYSNLIKILEKKYSNIKILFDAENYYSNGYDYNIALEKLKDFIEYVHIRDIKNNKYVDLFEGEINIKKILNTFKTKFISLETHLSMYDVDKEQKFIENFRRIENE